jgi:hypothetical protein
MRKTNDTLGSAALEDHRPLADSELDAVTGGSFELGNIVGQVAKATVVSPSGPPDVWVGCAWVPQWW